MFGAVTRPEWHIFQLFGAIEVNYYNMFLDVVKMPYESFLCEAEILELILDVEKLAPSFNYSTHIVRFLSSHLFWYLTWCNW